MALWDSAGWLAIGTYYAANDWANTWSKRRMSTQAYNLISSLSDEKLEEEIRESICNADQEDFDKIWCEIEEFKRDCPHLIARHIGTSYWGHVGKTRFPFTYVKLCEELGKSRLTNRDLKMLSTYRGWTTTLMMNVRGKHSIMEATRIAYRVVLGEDSSWTTEFG